MRPSRLSGKVDDAGLAVLLDAAGIVLGIVLLYGIALIVRRRVLARHGGTFELSHRVRTAKAGRGWVLGLGRYTELDAGVVPDLLAQPAPARRSGSAAT